MTVTLIDLFSSVSIFPLIMSTNKVLTVMSTNAADNNTKAVFS